MKKIYLFLATMMGLATTSSAQIIADLEAQIILPPEASTQTSSFNIPCDDSFNVDFLIINNGPGTIGATDSVLYQIPLNANPNQGFVATHGGQPVPPNDTVLHIAGKIKRNQINILLSAAGDAVETAPFADGDYLFFVYAAGFLTDTTIIKDNVKDNNIVVSKVKIACQNGISFNGLAKSELSLFPNPASKEVRFRAELTAGTAVVRVSDIAGRLIMTKNYGRMASGTQDLLLDVSSLNNGMYYLELINDDKRAIGKLSVQK